MIIFPRKAVCSFFRLMLPAVLVLLLAPSKIRAQVADTNKINAIYATIWPMHFRDIDSALNLASYCYQQAMQTPNQQLRMRTMHMVGVLEQENGSYLRSIIFLDSAITLAKRLGDQKRLGHLYNSIGMSYHLNGNYTMGMRYVLESAQIKKDIGDISGTVSTYINISALYGEQGDTAKSLDYAINAYALCYKNKVKEFYPEVNDALGKSYLACGDTMAGKSFLLKALEGARSANAPLKSLRTLENLVDLAITQRDTAEARSYLLLFDETNKNTNDRQHLSGLYYDYARYYLLKKNYALSEKFSRIAAGISETREKPDLRVKIYEVYIQALRAQNKMAEAVDAFQELAHLKDSVNAITREAATRRISAEYETKQRDEKIRQLNEKQRQSDAEIAEKNRQIYIVVAGLVLLGFFFFLFSRVYRRNRKNLRLLEMKNREIVIKNEIITSHNKDISDSIHYARRIQDALLTDVQAIRTMFADSFILEIPKDVLSGDFAWFAETSGKKIVAAADCTGHGIPGALLSIACSSFLSEIVVDRGITDPAQILSELRFTVIRALKQTGALGETRDGLDISLVVIDENKRKVNFSGANNSLCIVRSSQAGPEIEKIDGERRTVGYFLGRGLPFTGHEFSYSPGDAIYLYTDGYPDQFGGEENKKFRKKALMDLLLSVSGLDMKKQEEILLKAHREWRGDNIQTDDILVIGLRL
jgi:serine phosphatase RsbU (regulator of sigma subunit)